MKIEEIMNKFILLIIFAPYNMHSMSKKKWPILFSNLLYKMGYYFLDRLYHTVLTRGIPVSSQYCSWVNIFGFFLYECSVLN